MLCPAACAAAALNDPQCLEQIQKIAEADLACIDAHHPEYEHSTKSAFTRKIAGDLSHFSDGSQSENFSDEIQGVHRQTLADSYNRKPQTTRF